MNAIYAWFELTALLNTLVVRQHTYSPSLYPSDDEGAMGGVKSRTTPVTASLTPSYTPDDSSATQLRPLMMKWAESSHSKLVEML